MAINSWQLTTPDASSSLAKGPVYFGWWVVITAMIGAATGVSVMTAFAFGPFILPFQEEFGWSRGDISATLIFTTLSFVIVSPIFGALLDRFGVRKLLLLSTVLLGLLVGSLYTLNGSIWQLYLTYFLMPAIGAGTSPMAYSKLIVHWFDKRRGLALGIALAGIGIGAAVVPPLVQFFVDSSGWRMAYVSIAILLLALNLPLAYFFVFNTPQELGLAVDGESETTGDQTESNDGIELPGLLLSEATKTPSFWLMFGIFILVGIAFVGVIVHLVPMMVDRNMSTTTAAKVASAMGISLIAGRILAGYLMDRFFAPRVVIGFFLGPLIGIAILAMGATGSMAFLSAILIGIAIGAEFDVIAFFTSRYFGYRAYGKIYGWLYAAFTLGAGIGPILLGKGFDATGSYTPFLWFLTALIAVSILLLTFLGAYPDFTLTHKNTTKT